MGITVFNCTAQDIEVAVNRWGPGGSVAWHTIAPNATDDWDRSDSRGYIIWIRRPHLNWSSPYYTPAWSEISVYDDGVMRGDRGSSEAKYIPTTDSF